MTTRIIRITECAQCPSYYRNQQGLRYCIKAALALCPPTGTTVTPSFACARRSRAGKGGKG